MGQGRKGPVTNGKIYFVNEYDDGMLRITCDEGHDIWILGDLVETNVTYSASSRSGKRLLLTIPKQQRA